MTLPVRLSCPLGHKCEEAIAGEISRCAWFIEMRGQNPQTGAEVNERGCAIAWTPVLLVENARVNRGTSAAVESFRNSIERSNLATAQLLLERAP